MDVSFLLIYDRKSSAKIAEPIGTFALIKRAHYPFVLSLEEILNVERLALARFEQADALVDLDSQLAQFLDVRQQPLADLLLIGIRQAGHFRDCLFERLDHGPLDITLPGRKHANRAAALSILGMQKQQPRMWFR